MKYVVGYTLPYVHSVEVGIQADTPDEAIALAEILFDAGDIWNDTSECPLLSDDFIEVGDAGVPLEFEVEESIEDQHAFPESDGSVQRLRRDAKARAAARALVAAYRQGETSGGSVDWADIDTAYELALAAL